MQAYTPMPASEEAMTAFHEPDYISFLRHVTPDNQVRLSPSRQTQESSSLTSALFDARFLVSTARPRLCRSTMLARRGYGCVRGRQASRHQLTAPASNNLGFVVTDRNS